MASLHRPERILSIPVEPDDGYQVISHPRTLWPREADLTGWLAEHLDQLATCLGLRRLDLAGREVVLGERWTGTYRPHRPGGYSQREQIVGGMRVDLAARDEDGRLVVVEAQFGPADHGHLGQLVTYASATRADLAVWLVADLDPVFAGEHVSVLAEFNRLFAGSRRFCVVAATLESASSPVPLTGDVPARPRLRLLDLQTGAFVN
jgi:hypothetical protein